MYYLSLIALTHMIHYPFGFYSHWITKRNNIDSIDRQTGGIRRSINRVIVVRDDMYVLNSSNNIVYMISYHAYLYILYIPLKYCFDQLVDCIHFQPHCTVTLSIHQPTCVPSTESFHPPQPSSKFLFNILVPINRLENDVHSRSEFFSNRAVKLATPFNRFVKGARFEFAELVNLAPRH